MKVIAEWMELSIKQYEDGKYEGYEALSDSRCEGSWNKVRQWVREMLDDIGRDILRKEELKGG